MNIPIDKLLSMLTKNSRLMSYAVGMVQKNVIEKMGAASHVKIELDGDNTKILGTDGNGKFWHIEKEGFFDMGMGINFVKMMSFIKKGGTAPNLSGTKILISKFEDAALKPVVSIKATASDGTVFLDGTVSDVIRNGLKSGGEEMQKDLSGLFNQGPAEYVDGPFLTTITKAERTAMIARGEF